MLYTAIGNSAYQSVGFHLAFDQTDSSPRRRSLAIKVATDSSGFCVCELNLYCWTMPEGWAGDASVLA